MMATKNRRNFHTLHGNIISKSNMAQVYTAPKILQISICFTVILCSLSSLVSANRELNEDNWKEILDGEWMVEL